MRIRLFASCQKIGPPAEHAKHRTTPAAGGHGLLVGGKNVRFLASDTLLRTLHNSLTKNTKENLEYKFVELYMRYKLYFLEFF